MDWCYIIVIHREVSKTNKIDDISSSSGPTYLGNGLVGNCDGDDEGNDDGDTLGSPDGTLLGAMLGSVDGVVLYYCHPPGS
jgi:hypothetical protein